MAPFPEHITKNIELNYKEFFGRKEVLSSYPVKLYVEPTQRCNLDCFICYASRRKYRRDMPMDLFRMVERQLFPHAAEVNFFLTGESVLASHFKEMVSSCGRYDFLPKIFTNGMHLPDDIAGLYADLGFFVNFSFDAVSAGLFEKIRRGADFIRIVENIRMLRRLYDSGRSPRAQTR